MSSQAVFQILDAEPEGAQGDNLLCLPVTLANILLVQDLVVLYKARILGSSIVLLFRFLLLQN